MAIKKKTLLVENTPAKTAAKAAVKKAAIKSAARDVSKGVEATPIEVSDPKDPRLKSYNDSLSLYNNNPSPDKISKYYSNNIKAAYDLTTNPKKISARYNGKIKPIASILYNDKKAKAAESKGKSYGYFEPTYSPNEIKKEGLIKKNGRVYDKDGNLMVANVHSFKKPTQPIRLKKSTERVENGVLKADTVQSKPRVKRPGERIVPDNRSGNGYPNVDNVYINGKLDSIQNQAGERLKYGTKFTREWQYRKNK